MATAQSNGLVKALFADAEKHKGAAAKGKHEALTVSSKFLGQLSILKGILEAADTRFVRCIKTNDSASPQEVSAGDCNSAPFSYERRLPEPESFCSNSVPPR
jgi:myosin heavy subunit